MKKYVKKIAKLTYICYHNAICLQWREDDVKCADTLKKIRKQCLLSQKDFADAIGVSFSTVNRWENGKTVPNFKDLKKISEYCQKHGIPFDNKNEILEDK